MPHAFPQETVERSRQSFERWRSAYPHVKSKYDYARGAMEVFSENYGFMYNLQSGKYALWLHESIEENVLGYNCTTVIPDLYLHLEEFGIKPEIVQFRNFRRRKSKKDTKEQLYEESHFAVVADLGHRHRYLLDPFWKTFGPILKETKHMIRIGKNREYTAETRYFQQLLRYTPEEFAAMMDRLKDPAESLDMLIAGQKIFSKRSIQNTAADSMIYYHEEENQVKTRLYIRQVGFLDKVIYCRMNYDAAGERTGTSLELAVGKEAQWKSVTDEKIVARTDFPTLRAMKRAIRISQKDYRLGRELCKEEKRDVREGLFELVQKMWDDLSASERDAITIPVLTRTLYEGTDPQKKYLFPVTERNRHWKGKLDDFYTLARRADKVRQRLYFHWAGLRRLSASRAGKLRQEESRIKKKKEKVSKEEEELRGLYFNDRIQYHRNEDKRAFAAALKGKSVAELEAKVAGSNLNPLLGYLAIIVEYIPFVFDSRSSLEVPFGQEHLAVKIRARQAKKNGTEN